MSSLNSKDRVTLCLFTFTDGRRCRTPRTGNHPHFCFYHAQKEARASAAESLAKDLACFFSGDYLSACDLSTALSRLIPAVLRGDIKPKLARTIAFMIQTLMQTIRLSQDEYINAFSTDGWRKAVRNSVNSNYDYRFPPGPGSEQPVPPTETQTQGPTPAPQRPAPAPALQPLPTPSPIPQSSIPHTTAASPHASSTINQSAGANTMSPGPKSAPAQSAEPPASHAAQTPPPVPPTAADAALSATRPVFRRRLHTTSANSFKTNTYTTPRNC